jgi:endonuclease/exonuclease/phosphatase family metal-dependent hydrolase
MSVASWLAGVLLGLPAHGTEPAAEMQLRVMSFNAWHGGKRVDDGPRKIVEAIRAAHADIVGMQEARECPRFVAEQLGYHVLATEPQSVAILSRFPIVEAYPFTKNDAGRGARIRVSEDPRIEVEVFVAHLDYDPYGPYQAIFDRADLATILEVQRANQLAEMHDLLALMRPALGAADRSPVFLLGDFNTPSHLDWTAATRERNGGYVVDWPVSRAVEAVGLIDSFRAIHRDPVGVPGITWSPIDLRNVDRNAPEPLDRIDFVHFKGSRVTPVASEVFVVGEPAPIPNHATNVWPSDHAAVVSEFRVALDPSPSSVRVMTWNIWHGGKEDGDAGRERVVGVIRDSGADVVLMIETYGSGQHIAAALGFHLLIDDPKDNLSILSRWPIAADLSVADKFNCRAARVAAPQLGDIAFVDVWLPYAAEIWEKGTREKFSVEQMIAQNEVSSLAKLNGILEPLERKLGALDAMPVIFGGDFNAMSHRDYVPEAIAEYGFVANWPVSRRMEEAGFVDAWRALYPQVDRAADRTWSPRFPEQQQDRIDFLYSRGAMLKPVRARRIDSLPEPNAPFPSDHAALVVDFERVSR